MKKLMKEIKTPFLITIIFMLICGLFYPLLITGLGQALFPYQSNGSQLKENGKVIGSALIGQEFTSKDFMKGRPSAVNYNTYTLADKEKGRYFGVASGSQNLAPSNPELKKRVQKDMALFLENNPTVAKKDIPTDLLTASGSGLDPQISPASARVQVPEISKATGISEKRIYQIIENYTNEKFLGFIGEPTVNVLEVNIAIKQRMN